MKLKELFEAAEYDDSRLKKYSPEEIKAMPEVDASNVEEVYKVQGIVYDNVKGLGSTPNNQNIVYNGFVAEIKASDFLKLASQGDREKDADRMQQHMRNGVGIAANSIYFKINPEFEDGAPLKISIKQHEGRGRTHAFIKMTGDKFIPVQFQGQGGLKARDYNEDFFKQFRSIKFETEDGEMFKPEIKRIFWKGQTL